MRRSFLQRVRVYWCYWLLGLAVMSAVTIALLSIKGYLTDKRPLFVVNGYSEELHVGLGNYRFMVPPGGYQRALLPAGQYTLVYTGATSGTIHIEVTRPWYEPYLSKNYIINPGSEAVLGLEETRYYKFGPPPDATPDEYFVLYGEEIWILEHVDFVFTEFPRVVRSGRRKSSSATKKRLEICESDDVSIFRWLLVNEGKKEAHRFATFRLNQHPEDEELRAMMSD